MKRLSALFLSFVVVIVLCIEPVSAQTVPTTKTSEATILSAAEVDYPPFSIVDADGSAGGFSVELLTAALKTMGHDVHYQTGTWPQVRRLLETGEIDVLPLVGRTPEREQLFDFTFPYMSLHGAVVVRKGNQTIHAMEDLRGRTVAVMRGDNAQEYLQRLVGEQIELVWSPHA